MLSKEFLSMRVDCKDKHLQCCEQCKLSVLELTTKGHCCKMKSHDAVLSTAQVLLHAMPKMGHAQSAQMGDSFIRDSFTEVTLLNVRGPAATSPSIHKQ